MDVPLNHLSRDGRWFEPQTPANRSFDLGRKVGIGTHRPREFSNGHLLSDILEAAFGTSEFIEHQGHFEPEGGGFSMNAMAAPDHGGKGVFFGLSGNDLAKLNHVLMEDVHRFHHLHGKCRVDEITAGQTVVEPSGYLVIDILGYIGGKGDHIMVQRSLQFLAAIDGKSCPFLHFPKIAQRHQALLHQCLGGQQFNLEPYFQLSLFGPDIPHGGTCVTSYHTQRKKRHPLPKKK